MLHVCGRSPAFVFFQYPLIDLAKGYALLMSYQLFKRILLLFVIIFHNCFKLILKKLNLFTNRVIACIRLSR